MKPESNIHPHSLTSTYFGKWMSLTALLSLPLLALDPGNAQTPRTPDTFTARTTDMTPAGVPLRIQVIEWSDHAARAAVIATLTRAENRQRALSELPTIGYVWPSESGVGYALKYAHRSATEDGGERITVVSDRPVGTYDLRPWTAGAEAAPNAADYAVIELYLDGEGRGSGSMSLAAEVTLDEASATVSLARGDAPRDVLADAAHEPKPYWAEGDSSVP